VYALRYTVVAMQEEGVKVETEPEGRGETGLVLPLGETGVVEEPGTTGVVAEPGTTGVVEAPSVGVVDDPVSPAGVVLEPMGPTGVVAEPAGTVDVRDAVKVEVTVDTKGEHGTVVKIVVLPVNVEVRLPA